jgi:hypothetical protein
VKRDLESIPKKGVAGLRIDNSSHPITVDLDTSASDVLLDRSETSTTESDGNLQNVAVPVALSSGNASPQNTPSSSQNIADIFGALVLEEINVTPNGTPSITRSE